RVLRLRSRVFSCRSSAVNCLLTVGWVMFISRATAEKLPVSTIRTNNPIAVSRSTCLPRSCRTGMNDMLLPSLLVSDAKSYVVAMQQFWLRIRILKGNIMKTMRWLIAALSIMASTAFAGQAFAEEWSLVARDADEIVFVDRTSIFEVGDLKKARVLRSFSSVQTIGDTAFPHKSEIL